MSFVFHGLGTSHPPDAITPELGLRVARGLAGPDVRTSTWLGSIYENSAIRRRFQVIGGQFVQDMINGTNLSKSPFIPTAENDGVGPTTAERMQLYAKEAGPLALRAAKAAIAESTFAPDTLTHLITVSCTGFVSPGVDLALIRGLGLRQTVERTHIGFMGCHAAMNGLRVAKGFTSANTSARVLLCAVELCSLHYYYGNSADKLIANAIFADGAAAIVGAHSIREHNDTHGPPLQLIASGSCVIPETLGEMGWTVGDHGFEMMLSRKVPGVIARHLRPWLLPWLSDNGLSLDAVRSWAVHPGGPKILSAVEEGLELPKQALEASRGVFADYGNMSSPTVLFVLDRLRKTNASFPCVVLGFGPGLVVEGAIIDRPKPETYDPR